MKKTLSLLIALLLLFTALPGSFAMTAAHAEDETPSAVDLTGTVHLPPVGNQGQVGCCASMAITYMQFSNAVSRYLHAEDPEIEWDPSSGDPAYCFSPRFTYNLGGSGTAWVYEVLREQGCPTQEYAPFSGGPTGYTYNNILAKNWAAEDGVWSNAQYFRVKNYDQIWINNVCPDYKVTSTDEGRALIERIKASLRDGNVVVTGGYVTYWTNAVVTIGNTGTYGKRGDSVIPYSATGSSNAGGHQVCIIGYDDDITCTVNGVTLRGAFKLVNSWGTGWYNDGCIWMMYDAFNGAGQSEYEALNVEDRIWTMDQVVFLDWRTDLQIGVPELAVDITLTGADRDAIGIELTGEDRATGSRITYNPYIFRYRSRRGNYNALLTFNGRESSVSTAVITLSFDQLTDQLPAGKTIDDYIWGLRMTSWKQDVSTTLDALALKRNGQTVYARSDIGDEIDWSYYNYTLEADRTGVWSGGGWCFDEGVLTVWGEGDMDGYRDDPTQRPWADFADQITKVVIEKGVTSVGDCAFTHCDSLSKIVCGKDVTKVCYDAFSYNGALSEIVFNGPISEIGQGTVYGSGNLANLTVTGQTAEEFLAIASVKNYNQNYGSAAISVAEPQGPVSASGVWANGEWTLENGVLTITGSGRMTNFSDTTSAPWSEYRQDVTSIIISDGITSVGARAFSQMSELRSVVCGKDVASLGMDAFSYTPLYEIVFNRKIDSIAQGAVYSCGCLSRVTTTDQTKTDFLKIAHRTSYNTDFDNAAFFLTAPIVPVSSVTVGIYGSGMENWGGSPNKGKYDAVTQILFCPSEWVADYYTPGLTVTVNMKAVDGSSDDTFTTQIATVYSTDSFGVCRIEPCLMNDPWVPVKDKHYKATFTFVDPEGLTAHCTVNNDYVLSVDPIVPDPCDVNGSGRVTIVDVTFLLDALSNGTQVYGDPDRDGILSIRDVTVILDRLASHT